MKQMFYAYIIAAIHPSYAPPFNLMVKLVKDMFYI